MSVIQKGGHGKKLKILWLRALPTLELLQVLRTAKFTKFGEAQRWELLSNKRLLSLVDKGCINLVPAAEPAMKYFSFKPSVRSVSLVLCPEDGVYRETPSKGGSLCL